MLGASCSPCCASCPDFSFLLQAEAVRAELLYSFTDTNTKHGGYSTSFAGEFTIPRSGTEFPALPVAFDGQSYTLSFMQSGGLFSGLYFTVNRLATSDSWRAAPIGQPSPFGSVGIFERACGQSTPNGLDALVSVSTGTWSDTQFTVGNPMRPSGLFTFTFRRDNVTAFTGSNGSFPRIYRTNNNPYVYNLANWCEGTISRAVYRQSIEGDRFTKAEFYGASEFLGDWTFAESLSVTKLEAVFSSFSQNILFDVELPVWAINNFAMQTTGTGSNNILFDEYSTPCTSPFSMAAFG